MNPISQPKNYMCICNQQDLLSTQPSLGFTLGLPIEILSIILKKLTQNEKVPILRVNKLFYSITIRCLYHTIDDLSPRQCVACLQTLSRNELLPPLVRTLALSFSESNPTGNLFRLMHKVLRRLTSLTTLSIDLPKYQSPVWILDGCPFSLREFTTSMHCKIQLAKFLDLQPGITDLTLRGLQHVNVDLFPTIHLQKLPENDPDRFVLLPTSLPKLSRFHAVHLYPSMIEAVVQGRPLEVASVPLFLSNVCETLDALSTASQPLRRLSLLSFDSISPGFLFEQVSTRFSLLDALHIVVVMSDYSKEVLEEAAHSLSGFRSLKYITFMAAAIETSCSKAEECNIAASWQKCCPTLKTIILPYGGVWFQASTSKGWMCLDE